MTAQDCLKLRNILGALICIAFPDLTKKMAEAYNEMSKNVLDILMECNLDDGVDTETIFGDTLMHIMREGMADKLMEGKENDKRI